MDSVSRNYHERASRLIFLTPWTIDFESRPRRLIQFDEVAKQMNVQPYTTTTLDLDDIVSQNSDNTTAQISIFLLDITFSV